jgi:hypothetical protein
VHIATAAAVWYYLPAQSGDQHALTVDGVGICGIVMGNSRQNRGGDRCANSLGMRDEGTPSMDIAKSDVEPCSDRRLKRGHPDPWFMIAGDTPHSDSFDRTLAIQNFEFYFVRKWSRWHPQ